MAGRSGLDHHFAKRSHIGGIVTLSERYRDQQLLLNTEIQLESPMPRPNMKTMSVRQLIDIVAFLDSKYQLMLEGYD